MKNYSSCYIDPLYDYISFWDHEKLKPKSFSYPLSDEKTALQICSVFVKTKSEVEVNIRLLKKLLEKKE